MIWFMEWPRIWSRQLFCGKPNEIPDKNKNWRTNVVNANSIRGKQAEIKPLIYNLKPYVIIVTETKLG